MTITDDICPFCGSYSPRSREREACAEVARNFANANHASPDQTCYCHLTRRPPDRAVGRSR